MGSSFLALNLRFGEFLKKILKNFQNEVESLNIGYLDVGKLLNGEIPIDTKCDLRFAKI